MIVINMNEYNNFESKVFYGEYDIHQDNKQTKGDSIIIKFSNDNILLTLETTYDKNYLLNMLTNKENDITKYITGIYFEDESGFLPLDLNDNYTCTLVKINNDIYKIKLDYSSDIFNVSIDEEVKL